jgi:hypothetical protein
MLLHSILDRTVRRFCVLIASVVTFKVAPGDARLTHGQRGENLHFWPVRCRSLDVRHHALPVRRARWINIFIILKILFWETSILWSFFTNAQSGQNRTFFTTAQSGQNRTQNTRPSNALIQVRLPLSTTADSTRPAHWHVRVSNNIFVANFGIGIASSTTDYVKFSWFTVW